MQQSSSYGQPRQGSSEGKSCRPRNDKGNEGRGKEQGLELEKHMENGMQIEREERKGRSVCKLRRLGLRVIRDAEKDGVARELGQRGCMG